MDELFAFFASLDRATPPDEPNAWILMRPLSDDERRRLYEQQRLTTLLSGLMVQALSLFDTPRRQAITSIFDLTAEERDLISQINFVQTALSINRCAIAAELTIEYPDWALYGIGDSGVTVYGALRASRSAKPTPECVTSPTPEEIVALNRLFGRSDSGPSMTAPGEPS